MTDSELLALARETTCHCVRSVRTLAGLHDGLYQSLREQIRLVIGAYRKWESEATTRDVG